MGKYLSAGSIVDMCTVDMLHWLKFNQQNQSSPTWIIQESRLANLVLGVRTLPEWQSLPSKSCLSLMLYIHSGWWMAEKGQKPSLYSSKSDNLLGLGDIGDKWGLKSLLVGEKGKELWSKSQLGQKGQRPLIFDPYVFPWPLIMPQVHKMSLNFLSEQWIAWQTALCTLSWIQ